MGKCTIKNGKYFALNGEESLLYKNLRENMSQEEANDLFIVSKTPTFKERVEIPLIEEYKSRIIQIPSNIKFKETNVNKIRTFHIYDGKSKIGRIQLTPYKEGFKVKSSLVNENQKGKGYGKYLYNYTISRLLVENNTLYTDTARTEDADRIWESLKRQGLSQDGRTVKPFPKEFDNNGEIKAELVLQYVANNFSETIPLTAVEKSHLINLQIEGVETSDDLYNVLYDAFYKNNLFSPNINKLKKIYSEDEIRNILEDSEIQGIVKETIEKLRQTEEFTIPQIDYNKDFDYRSSKVNIIGQYKRENPLRLEKEFIEETYTKVPVINEEGFQLETQLFYEGAIKLPNDKVIRGVTAVVEAHPLVDTTKLENNLIKGFKNYGMNIEGLKRENFINLLNYITNPTDENRKSLEDALGFVREPLTKPINILPENRSYQYLKTAKSEQELFDEMSLIQTSVSNVYHKVNKIDEQEIRDIVTELKSEEVEEIPILDFIKGTEVNTYIEYEGMFSKTSTGTSYDDIFEDTTGGRKGYFFFYKKEKARIEMMSPDEYLKRVRNGFGVEKDENITPQSKENILKGIEKGDKINMPFLNYIDGKFSQEGRNRASLARERGEKLIPVLVLDTVSQRYLESVSEDMLDNLTDKYNFNSKGELLDAVSDKYKLHRDAKRYIETNILEDYSFFNERGKLEYKKENTQDLTIPDYQLYKDYYGYTTPEISKDILTIETDIEYLLNDFIADFAIEKLKKPTEFNKQFKVTENGLELVSDDIITLEIVKAYIQDEVKYSKEIADYSLLSKDMPNLKEKDSFTVDSIVDRRIKAVNDINSVNKPTTEITIIDEESVFALNETQQFLRINNSVFEQQEQGYYNKLQKNTNPNFFNLNPQAPEFKNFDIQQEEVSENKAKKLISKEMNQENFSCI